MLGTTPLKVDLLFEDRPEVKDSIIRARRDQKLSFSEISRVLNLDPAVEISDGAVKSWLTKKGVA